MSGTGGGSLAKHPVLSGPPPAQVLATFSVPDAVPRRLAGGQGSTWLADGVVLKPVSNASEAEWVAAVLATLPEDGFRASRPIRSTSGTWTVAGWSAWRKLDGGHDFNRWLDVLTAGRALHRALHNVDRPDFLDDRRDDWSVGDRVAWDDDVPALTHAELRPLAEQFAALRSACDVRSQVIHGDLTGNVLFADPAAPAIIDFVPYWRPASFGLAIVVADAVAWHRAGAQLVDHLPPDEDPRAMLARAAIYRLVTSDRAATRMADPSAYLKHNVAAHLRLLEVLRSR